MEKLILLFSRGQGTGHAMRDIIVADCLSKLDGDVEVKFVSYADGYRAFSSKGRSCINIGLPSRGEEHDRIIRIGKVIREETPNLIVSDEELLALPLAKVFQIPSLLITNWFPPAFDHPTMSYFADPDEIIFPDLDAKTRPTGSAEGGLASNPQK